jgi:branched-chain amino acid transport system ATP-binding protein
MLSGEGISLWFGGLAALRSVSFQINAGEIVGLLGPNGSGKSSLFHVISGIYHPSSGSLVFAGHDLQRVSPHRRVHLGIGRTFQTVRPFAALNVAQTVLGGALFGQPGRSLPDAQHETQAILRLLDLEQDAQTRAHNLPLVKRKRLEIARALATAPRLLLLDEVFAGLTPTEIDAAMHLVRRVRDEQQITIVMVEHIIRAARQVCDRVIVLHEGQTLFDGTPAAMRHDPAVIAVYLGNEPDHA